MKKSVLVWFSGLLFWTYDRYTGFFAYGHEIPWEPEWSNFELKFYPLTALIFIRKSTKFGPERMYPYGYIHILKNVFLRLCLKIEIFSIQANISVTVHLFWLKLWEFSNDYESCLWIKFQLEIRSFSFSWNLMSISKRSSIAVISPEQKTGKPNQNRLFHYSPRPIEWQSNQAKSDLTVGDVPSSVTQL